MRPEPAAGGTTTTSPMRLLRSFELIRRFLFVLRGNTTSWPRTRPGPVSASLPPGGTYRGLAWQFSVGTPCADAIRSPAPCAGAASARTMPIVRSPRLSTYPTIGMSEIAAPSQLRCALWSRELVDRQPVASRRLDFAHGPVRNAEFLADLRLGLARLGGGRFQRLDAEHKHRPLAFEV